MATKPNVQSSSVKGGELADDRRWLADWLLSFEHAKTGVRVESFITGICRAASPEGMDQVRRLIAANQDEAAIRALSDDVVWRVHKKAVTVLNRLLAVLVCSARGIEIPARSEPVYKPIKGRLFYLVHMRDPHELNGYVVRTHYVLRTLENAGFAPEPITRLGFPNDLARHRDKVIPDVEVVRDISFRSLRDEGGGLLQRGLDEYIQEYADRIVDLALKRRPAAIHAASNYLNGLAAIVAARQLGIPCVYEVRGIWEITQASADPSYASTIRYDVQRTMENLAVCSADRVVTISGPLRDFVIDNGARPDDVVVLPNGVDVETLHETTKSEARRASLGIPADAVVVGYVGSIIYYEGLDLVLRAIALLRDRGMTSLHFLVVGSGAALEALKEETVKLALEDVCHFTGRVPREEVEELYSIVDIAPFPRRSLPVTELVPPLKPYEAMVCGKAVIVSDVAALRDAVLHQVTGLVAKKDNIESLADALETLANSREARETLGRQAREWVLENRSVAAFGPVVRTLYESIGVLPRPKKPAQAAHNGAQPERAPLPSGVRAAGLRYPVYRSLAAKARRLFELVRRQPGPDSR